MTSNVKLFNLVMMGVRQVNGCVKATCDSVAEYLLFYYCVSMTEAEFGNYVNRALQEAACLGYLEVCKGEYWVTGLAPPSGCIEMPNICPTSKLVPPCPNTCDPISVPKCLATCPPPPPCPPPKCPPPCPPPKCPPPCPPPKCPLPCPPPKGPPACPSGRCPLPCPPPPKCPKKCRPVAKGGRGVLPKCTFELQERKLARAGLLLTPTVAVAAKRKNSSASNASNRPVGKVRPLSSSPSCSSPSHQLELKPKEEILAFHISQKKKSLLLLQQQQPS